MRVYISGPIDGLPDRNEKAFRAAERYLNTLGYETLVPLDVPAFEHRNGEAKCPRGYTDGGGHSSALLDSRRSLGNVGNLRRHMHDERMGNVTRCEP
jgi:hypothetical protein